MEAFVDDVGNRQGLQIGEKTAGGAGGVGLGAGSGLAEDAAEKLFDLNRAVMERAGE